MGTADLGHLHWYLIKTRPRDEEKVLYFLNFARYSHLFPTYWKAPLFGRKRERKPLFPGYIFVHVKLEEAYHKIRYTRGVSGFVRFGELPLRVPNGIIESLKARTHGDGTVRMVSKPLRRGDLIRITDGPFAGFEGVFVESLNDGERIALLIQGLNSARVEVNRLFTSAIM